ncbi:hypothetical protein L1887_19533 [Cichorium endivia]|nr:hypothetical protein L1887_19533 [Cichorium endivia]
MFTMQWFGIIGVGIFSIIMLSVFDVMFKAAPYEVDHTGSVKVELNRSENEVRDQDREMEEVQADQVLIVELVMEYSLQVVEYS